MISRSIPDLAVGKSWENILSDDFLATFKKEALFDYLKSARWFGGKSKTIVGIDIRENAIFGGPAIGRLLILEVSYSDDPPEHYLLPICYATGSRADRLMEDVPQHVICRISVDSQAGVLFDGSQDERLQTELLAIIAESRGVSGHTGIFRGIPGSAFGEIAQRNYTTLPARALKVEQSNSSIVYGNSFFMKLYRKLEMGRNPELEIISFLSEQTDFTQIPPFGGAIEYQCPDRLPMTVSLLQGFVTSTADAWTYTLDEVIGYFGRILRRPHTPPPASDKVSPLFSSPEEPSQAEEFLGDRYLEMVKLLGIRTAQMHRALGSSTRTEEFTPEPFTMQYQNALYESMRNLVHRTFQSFSRNKGALPGGVGEHIMSVLSLENAILETLGRLTHHEISATRTRIHGDYHLGQVLYTGDDFIIMDFEGEPARSINERKVKHSPFKDVAGMIRSFHYAAYVALFLRKSFQDEDIEYLESWDEPLFQAMSSAFMNAYLDTAAGAHFIPDDRAELEALLHIFLLEKAVYELGYELNNRPEWVRIPVKGIEHVIQSAA